MNGSFPNRSASMLLPLLIAFSSWLSVAPAHAQAPATSDGSASGSATDAPSAEPAGSGRLSRDQHVAGDPNTNSLSRLSFFGGLGYGSVRGGSGRFTPSGGFSFDAGLAVNVVSPLQLGVAFNHLRFEDFDRAVGLNFPREVSDLTGFVRLDGRDGRAIPYVTAGAGFYFADNSSRSDLFRVGFGIDVQVSRTLLRLEGRYSSYGAGAFLGQDSRQSTLSVIFGLRVPLFGKQSALHERSGADRVRQSLRYIADPDEQRELDGIESDRELLAFVERFWRKRDPFPEVPGNPARDEHEHRVAIAATNFGEMGRGGWLTERGRAMIIHGQPDEIVWESDVPRVRGRDPQAASLPADLTSTEALELWIYYKPLRDTEGNQSLFLFEEDAVSRYLMIWSNVASERGFRRSLPPLPPSIAGPISAVSGVY